MKKIVIGVCAVFCVLSVVCAWLFLKDKNDVIKEKYTLTDFETIVVGQSTLDDLSKVVPTESIMVTSYGGLLQFPSKNNQVINVGLSKDWVVVFIQKVQKETEDGSVVSSLEKE